MSYAQKTPLSRGLTLYVNWMIRKFLDRLAKGRPASVVAVNGSIVTVKFEMAGVTLPQVTMPLAGPEYIRYPTQVGDKGLCVPCDYYLGAMSGLGSGTADTTPRGNLSTLVFQPIGNKNWTAPDDTQALVLYGPNGVILRDTGSKSKLTLTPTNIDLAAQDNIDLNAQGGNLTTEANNEQVFTVGSTTITMNGTEIVFSAGGVTATLSAAGFVVDSLIQGNGLDSNGSAITSDGGNISCASGRFVGSDFNCTTTNFGLYTLHRHSGVTTGTGNTAGPFG